MKSIKDILDLKEATEWRKPQWELPPDARKVMVVIDGRVGLDKIRNEVMLGWFVEEDYGWYVEGLPDFVGTIEAWMPLPEVKG